MTPAVWVARRRAGAASGATRPTPVPGRDRPATARGASRRRERVDVLGGAGQRRDDRLDRGPLGQPAAPVRARPAASGERRSSRSYSSSTRWPRASRLVEQGLARRPSGSGRRRAARRTPPGPPGPPSGRARRGTARRRSPRSVPPALRKYSPEARSDACTLTAEHRRPTGSTCARPDAIGRRARSSPGRSRSTTARRYSRRSPSASGSTLATECAGAEPAGLVARCRESSARRPSRSAYGRVDEALVVGDVRAQQVRADARRTAG